MYNNFFNPMQRNNNGVSNQQRDNNNQPSFDPINNQRLSGIDPIKLKIIMEIREKSKNKSVEELLPEIMKINQELNRRNMNFSKSETEMLLEVIEESLSPSDRQRFNMLKGFISQ